MKRQATGLILLFACTAHAEEAGVTDIYAMDLEQLAQLPVSTPTRTSEAVQHSAGTVLVFTRDQIKTRGYRNLAELLQALPGIYVQGNSSSDAYNTVSWRGISGNDKFIILQNGVRIGTPANDPLAIADNLPLYYVKQIEIVYGPGSALYGSDALAGVINIITDTEDDGDSAVVSAEKGDIGYDRASARGHYANSWLHLSAGAQRQSASNTDLITAYPSQYPLTDLDNGTVFIPAGERQPYNGATQSWQAYADALLGEHWQFGYNGSHFRQPSTVSDLSSFGNYGATLTSDIHTWYGRYRFGAGENFNGQFTANYADYELTPDSAYDNGFSNYQRLYKYAESQRRQAELVVNEQWAANATLTAGIDAEKIQAIPKTADLPQPYVQGESAAQQGLYYAGTGDTLPIQIFDVHYEDYDAFLQQQLQFNRWLRAILGLRYDHYSNFGGSTNPRLALVAEPDATQKISLSLGRAFLAPSPYYTYEFYGSFDGTKNAQGLYQATQFQVPNPALGPERLQSLELDYQWRPTGAWQLAAAVYHNRLSGFIDSTTTQPAESNYVPGGSIAVTTTNINDGEVDVDGTELRLDHSSGALQTWASLSLEDGKQRVDGQAQPIPYTPRQGGKFGLSWTGGGGYSLSPSLYCAGPSAPGHPNDSAPGFAIANVYARREHVLSHVNIFARVDDIFDQAWYGAGPGDSTTLYASPQNRRSYTLGLELEF